MNPLYPILFNTSALMGLTAIHFFWLIGGKTGMKYAFPHNSKNKRKIYNPGMLYLLLATGLLAAMTGFCFARAGLFNSIFSDGVILWGNRLTGIVFVLRAIGNFKYTGLTKAFKDSQFSQLDTYIYCPLCLLIAVCAWI